MAISGNFRLELESKVASDQPMNFSLP